MNCKPTILEITAVSAQGLKSSSTLFFHRRLRPFATITTTTCCKKLTKVYQTKADDEGGVNPTWGDKFQLPLDAAFFTHQIQSFIFLQLYTKNFFIGYTHLGWCRIPVNDILDGFLPAGFIRHLAYQLRARDGSRGHGIVNVAVKLENVVPLPIANPEWSSKCSNRHIIRPDMNESRMVIGIPTGLHVHL